MAVTEMYRETGDPKYLELSEKLIDIRGKVETAPTTTRTACPSASNIMPWVIR